jgi:hypothetical protein
MKMVAERVCNESQIQTELLSRLLLRKTPTRHNQHGYWFPVLRVLTVFHNSILNNATTFKPTLTILILAMSITALPAYYFSSSTESFSLKMTASILTGAVAWFDAALLFSRRRIPPWYAHLQKHSLLNQVDISDGHFPITYFYNPA